MSYEIGSRVDISNINKQATGKALLKKNSFTETAQKNIYSVGTTLKFKLTEQGYKTALSIPVSFA